MKRKTVLSLLSAAALILMLCPMPVLAATEGSVTGQFGINAAPTVDSVSLTETAMTPQTEYMVSVQVSDPDTINDLAAVELKLWYDADGGAPTEAEHDSQTADVQNCAVITWTADDPGGTTYSGTVTLLPSGTTWALGTCTLPEPRGGNPGDFGLTTFTYQFVFTVGKVATETTGTAVWQVAAKATDAQNQSSWNSDGEGSSMNWYGEIIVPTATVDWGQLPPGTDFADTGAQQAIGVSITYLANGAYDEKVKSDATWSGATYTATLDPTGVCDTAQEFALKADDTATYADAVLVDNTGVTIDDTGGQTTETGESVASNNLWMKLANSFNKDTYQGAITYIIANGT